MDDEQTPDSGSVRADTEPATGSQDDREPGAGGLRGDGLADGATPAPTTEPADPAELADGAIRGDGLAEDAVPADAAVVDPTEEVKGTIRGVNGLATDA